MTHPRHSALIASAILTGLLGVSSAPAEGQEETLQSAVLRWLETTCGVADESFAPPSLEDLSTDAVPLFIEAFDTGPTNAARQQIRAAAGRRFDRIQQLVNEGRTFGLREEDLNVLRQTGRDQFVDRAVQNFVFTYEDAALRAVRVLDSPEGRNFLQRVAADSSSRHAQTAARLLREPV